ncbi:MAG: energy transducer TonB [Flavobacteriaceae bacterium]|nr:energy transducer TonB [Flavobacteriaceae bacterium]
MKTKKNPRQQLENFSKIFFQIGIVLTLFILHVLIEHKTYEKEYSNSLKNVAMVDELQEDIPIVEMKDLKPPPPKTPTVVEQIKVVEDDLKIEETIVESTETDENEAVIITEQEIVEEEEEEVIVEDIPFVLIQDVPVFPGCEGNNSQLKKCFSQKVQEYFLKNFNTGLANELGLRAGKKKLFVVFRIDKDGFIKNVKSRGPHPLLEKEVVKIISGLPQMKPGKQRGIAVSVSYSIPITFQVVL